MANDKESLFKRLQSYSPRQEKSSKEDFFTESLAFVLKSEEGLLREYVRFLLEKFKIQNNEA